MFTVVITEQVHLDSINQYHAFLEPFLNNSQIAFCRWEHSGRRLAEAVPELYATVARHEKWRMVVLCDEEGLSYENPFDLVGYTDPVKPEDMDEDAFLEMRREGRLNAYQAAAKKPLTRLVTWLCQPPLVTEGIHNAQDLDPEFGEYLIQNREKDALRREILGNEIPEITLPAEVICVAKRCFTREPYDIQNAWSIHQELLYSRFYDWNLYFDKMRYLVFDILPKNHRNYAMDYIRFLYAVMLLAANDIPMASLNPNRVYALECQNDEKALQELLRAYDLKLASTLAKIRSDIHNIENKPKPRLSDRDAAAIFCSKLTVPVTMVNNFQTGDLYITDMQIGLSGNCPEVEEDQWQTRYVGSRRSLLRYFKLPRRSLKKATTDLRRMNKADLDEAGRLNEFQLEDVADHTAEEELKMVQTRTCGTYDVERYGKMLEQRDKQVHSVMEKRMTRNWTIAISVAVLVLYLFSFLPMLLDNLKAEEGVYYTVLFLLVGVLVMALTAFIVLLLLRLPVLAAIRRYNSTMKKITLEVEGSLANFSKYLSHACNVMRGNSVLNFRKNSEHPDAATIRVLRKHEMDLLCVREEVREVFGTFLPQGEPAVDLAESYPYDFTRPVDFDYPIPFSRTRKARIEFLQKGNLVQTPVDFVKCMHVRREDLYD